VSGGPACTTLLCAALLLVPTRLAAQVPDSAEFESPPVAQQADSAAMKARSLADGLYGRKQLAEARKVYETALALHPEDDELRLAYGRMLVETLDVARARAVLAPLAGRSQGRAESLLGTNAYWSGDFSLARRYFIDALRADSTLASARLQLYEIAAATAPLIRLEPAIASDDQPLRRMGVAARSEYFLTPLLRTSFRFDLRRYYTRDSLLRTVGVSEAAVSLYEPRSRLEAEVAAGVVGRGVNEPIKAIRRLSVAARLPHHLVLRLRGEREPYFHTLASLATPIETSTGVALLEWKGPRGALGEAAAERQRYADDNAIMSAYAWFLTPVSKSRSAELQAGYAFSTQDADRNRFVLARPRQQFPASDPRFDLRGRYWPYHTPDHLMTHSVLLAATTRLGSTHTLRTNASFGVLATDRGPVLYPNPPGSSADVGRTSYRRNFHPWSARSTLNLVQPTDWRVAITAEFQRTAYYSAGSVGVQLTNRFTRAAVRRVDRY